MNQRKKVLRESLGRNTHVLKEKIFDYMRMAKEGDPQYQLTYHVRTIINENTPYVEDFLSIEELLNTVCRQIKE